MTPAEPGLESSSFYVDENFAAVGRAMQAARRDVVSAADLRDCMPRHDEDWIPIVAKHGLVVITNDRHIRTRGVEARTALESGLRCAHIRPTRAKNPNAWTFLCLLTRYWKDIDALRDTAGPVWLSVTSSGTRNLEYGPRDSAAVQN